MADPGAPTPPAAIEPDHNPAGPGHGRAAWREVALVFLKLGTTAFGGPAAHIAMMDDELVGRRRWVTRQRFLDLLGGTNLIPGPNSTEMAMHLGHERAGWLGLVVGGAAFILPSFLLVLVLAVLYRRYGSLPPSEIALYGIKPVIIAVIAQAVWTLGRTAVKSAGLALLTLAAIAAAAAGAHELAVIFGAGLAAAAPVIARRRAPPPAAAVLPLLSVAPALAAGGTTSAGLLPLFLVFLKIGSVLFGSGYVLVAFLRADLVQRLGWLRESQLLDAVAVGQMTPGPVSTTATFIGYLLGGVPAAVVATIGIFLPAFLFVAASAPLLARMRQSRLAAAFLDGVNVGSLAAMVLVSWQLGRAAIVDPLTAVIAIVALALLLTRRVNSAWLVLAGAATSLLRHALTS
jgi:chromate transporter